MIAARERRAFERFVQGHGDRLVRTAYLLTGDREDAEDLAQTALLRTARRWRTAREAPEAYARTVLVNLAKDRWRRRSRRVDEVPLADVDPPADGADPLLDRDLLLRAARTLPEGQRAVLVLRFFDDLSVEETARVLGCTTGTVKSQTSRALAGLRRALTPEPHPAPTKENAHAH